MDIELTYFTQVKDTFVYSWHPPKIMEKGE